MMGEQPRSEPLFYYFRLEDQIPEHHLLRRIDRYVDFRFVRERLRQAYSHLGRPSIDPEILLRLLLVGYLYGITSERRLMEEVRMHLAYRWFTRLGFEQEIPDHSTFSKNRHGRFRDSGIFLEVFEEVVQRCLQAGLVEGKRLSVDGTAVTANASPQSRVPREELAEVAKLSRTVREYLAEVGRENPVSDPGDRPPTPTSAAAQWVSATDPEACWAGKGGPAVPSYYDHYLIDNAHGIILLYHRHYTPGQLKFITTGTHRGAPVFLSDRFRHYFVLSLFHSQAIRMASFEFRFSSFGLCAGC